MSASIIQKECNKMTIHEKHFNIIQIINDTTK